MLDGYLQVMDHHVAEDEIGGVVCAFNLHFNVLNGLLVLTPVNTVL